MTMPICHRAVGLLLGAALFLAVGTPARAAAAGVADARISTSFVMHGQIVTAVRVRGEYRGQAITRAAGVHGAVVRGERLPPAVSAPSSQRPPL